MVKSQTLLQKISLTSNRSALVLFLLALVLAAVAITMMSPIMDDIQNTFLPPTRQWLAGTSILYDRADARFFNAPWVLGLFMPLVSLPLPVAEVIFTALMLCCVLMSIISLDEAFPIYLIALAIINQPFLNMIGNGEIDAIPLLGIGTGYLAIKHKNFALLAASFCLMAIKPNNILLVILLFLFVSREWRAILFPIGLGLISALFIGFDWPLRYIQDLRGNPLPVAPLVSLWRSSIPPALLVVLALVALTGFAYLVWHEGLTLRTLSLALATGLAFGPYVLSAHYVMLIPAFLFVTKKSLPLGIILYLTTWTLVVASPLNAVWLASLYPLAVLVFVWAMTIKDLPPTKSDTTLSAERA